MAAAAFMGNAFDIYVTNDATANIVIANPVDFTYALFDAAGTRAVLNASAGDSRINVLSSPSILVLDNQTATIRVGDQVPIRTSETEFLASTTGNITSRIEQPRYTSSSAYPTPIAHNDVAAHCQVASYSDRTG